MPFTGWLFCRHIFIKLSLLCIYANNCIYDEHCVKTNYRYGFDGLSTAIKYMYIWPRTAFLCLVYTTYIHLIAATITVPHFNIINNAIRVYRYTSKSYSRVPILRVFSSQTYCGKRSAKIQRILLNRLATPPQLPRVEYRNSSHPQYATTTAASNTFFT